MLSGGHYLFPLVWPLLYGYFWCCYHTGSTIKTIGLAGNLTAAFHATLSCLLYLGGTPFNIIAALSTCYYIFDVAAHTITYFQGYSPSADLGSFAHHVVAVTGLVCFLDDPEGARIVFQTFFLCELSNWPIYGANHYARTGHTDRETTQYLLTLEVLSYSIFRVGLCLPLLIDAWGHSYLIAALGSAIYFGSIVWTLRTLSWVPEGVVRR